MDEEVVHDVVLEEVTKKAQSVCKLPESWDDDVGFFFLLLISCISN
jgi:hypothetical protein